MSEMTEQEARDLMADLDARAALDPADGYVRWQLHQMLDPIPARSEAAGGEGRTREMFERLREALGVTYPTAEEITAAALNAIAERNHMRAASDPFIEWAQDRDRFDSGRWAGFSVFHMVMTEFDEMRKLIAKEATS